MSGWLIELFAHAVLTKALWALLAMTAPFWVLMVALPHKRWVQLLASPYFAPVIFNGVLIYFYYLAFTVGPPELPQDVDFKESKAFIAHPLMLLVFVGQLQVLQLFMGTIILREARARNVSARLELLMTWWFGPIGWLFFALRIKCFKRRS